MKPSGTVENASQKREKNKSELQAKLLLRYVVDIVRTVKGDPEKVLRAATNYIQNYSSQ